MKGSRALAGKRRNETEWRDHSLDDPAQDAEGSTWLEEFVGWIGSALHPGYGRDRKPKEMQEEVAAALRRASKIGLPFTEDKVIKLLDLCGIFCITEPKSLETTFLYSLCAARWEIHVRKGNPQYWSREVFHDLWEILFWRCFHRINWWPDWARQQKIESPHGCADEFAYQVLLPYQSVHARVPRLGYDLWRVCDFYQVPPQLGFRAITAGASFSVPFFHGLLWLDVEAPVQDQTSLLTVISPGLVHSELRKRALKRLKTGGEGLSDRDPPGVERLGRMPSEGTVFPHAPDDPVYQACRTLEGISLETNCVFGYRTGEPVALVLRLSPQNSRSVYLQAVPPESVEMLLPENSGSWMSGVSELPDGWLDA